MQINKKLWSGAIIVGLFGLLLYILLKDLDKIRAYDLHLDYSILLLSIVLLVVHFIFVSIGWFLIIKKMGFKIPIMNALRIRLISDFGRFLPGKVWIFVGRAHMCKKLGIPVLKTGLSTVLDILLNILGATLITIVTFIFVGASFLPQQLYWLIFIAPLALIIIHPKVFNLLLKLLMKLMKKEYSATQIKFKDIIYILFFVYFPAWILAGLAFFLFINSITDVGINLILVFSGILAASWLGGYLSIIVPGGFGVREGLLSLLLSIYLPLPIAIFIALLSRIWMVGSEVLATLLFIKNK